MIRSLTKYSLGSCLVFALIFLLTWSCKKKEAPVQEPTPVPAAGLASLTTGAVTDIQTTSAKCSGNVTAEGSSALTSVGLCWDTLASPTTLRPHTSVGAGTGAFAVTIDQLKFNKKYYVRAYATNFNGTAYGNEVEFTTKADPLVGKTFKMIAWTVTPSKNGTSNFFSLLWACQKDDFWRFDLNNVLFLDEGPSKCAAQDPQSLNGSWIWSKEYTELSTTINNNTRVNTVLQNDGTILKLSFMEGSDTTYNHIQTFQKQ